MLHRPLDMGNVVAVYLLGVMLSAAWLGRGPAVFASVLGALAVDFLFLPPVFGFVPDHAAHLLTFVVMLTVAMTVSTMAARLREQLQQAQVREQRTATLYGLARDLARSGDATAVARAVDHHAGEQFRCRAVLLVKEADARSSLVHAGGPPLDDGEMAAAHFAIETPHRIASSMQPPVARGTYLPLTTGKGTVGVLGLLPEGGNLVDQEARSGYLEAFANQTAVALERTLLADAAQRSAVAVEQERLRNTLLSSVSHDLRTPIATIIGASSTLLRDQPLEPRTQKELLESIHEEGGRLERQVRNLLYMTRLEAGTVRPECEWTPVEDVVGAALTRLEEGLKDRSVVTDLGPDVPPVPMDGLLVEQVLLNLLENALRHTPPGTPIEIVVRTAHDCVRIEVADRGPGIPPATIERIFEKFHTTTRAGGSGLGLAICRAITTLHGGSIAAANRDGGGARFTVVLPLTPPLSLPPLAPAGHGGQP